MSLKGGAKLEYTLIFFFKLYIFRNAKSLYWKLIKVFIYGKGMGTGRVKNR